MHVLDPAPVGGRFPGEAGAGRKAVEFIGIVIGLGEPVLVPHGIGDDAVEGAELAALVLILRCVLRPSDRAGGIPDPEFEGLVLGLGTDFGTDEHEGEIGTL